MEKLWHFAFPMKIVSKKANISILIWFSVIPYQYLFLENPLEGLNRWRLHILSRSSTAIRQHLPLENPLESQNFHNPPVSLFSTSEIFRSRGLLLDLAAVLKTHLEIGELPGRPSSSGEKTVPAISRHPRPPHTEIKQSASWFRGVRKMMRYTTWATSSNTHQHLMMQWGFAVFLHKSTPF